MDDRQPTLDRFRSPPRRELSPELIRTSEQVARGGNAIVSVVELDDEQPPDRVAVKEPLAPGTLVNEEIDRFLSQAETWETVDRTERERARFEDSEHVVGVVDTGDRLPWIAMEYMDGGTLTDRLADADGGLPVAEALWIGEGLCRGIAVAHSLGIAHLDVKPANVLFRSTPDDVWDLPKVADWGLARVLADQTGTVPGLSPSYAAPEQFDTGEFGEPDTLTDVYQVGAVLYELLTGTSLAPESRFQAMQVAMSSEPPAPPSAERPELDPAVDAVVTAALERKKTDRYSAIQVMADTLRTLRVGGELPPIVTKRLDGSDGARDRVAAVSSSSSPDTDQGNERDTGTGISEPDGDSDIVDRVADYDNSGSYSASPGDHEGISPDATEATTDPDHSEEVPQDDHATEQESMADRVAAYERSGSYTASGGDHSGVSGETGDIDDWGPVHLNTAPVSGWPTFGGCFARTGTTAAATGPDGDVSVVWSHSTSDPVGIAPAVEDGVVFAGPHHETLRALNAESGDTIWTSPSGLSTSSAPAVTDERVFVGGWGGDLYSLDRSSGRVQWTFEAEGPVYGSPTVADETVYVGGRAGTLHALDTDSGQKVWSHDCGQIKSAPTVVDGTVYVGTKGDAVHAIDQDSGEAVWTYRTNRPVWSSPVVIDGVVYVACWDDHVYALDEQTGELSWQLDTGRSIPGSLAAGAHSLFVGNNANDVYAIDPTDGTVRWQTSVSGSVRSTVAVVDETVLAPSVDGTLFALGAETGEQRWSIDLGSRIHSSPAVSDGTIYVGTADGLYALTDEA